MKPTSAYIGASWAVLLIGMLGFLIGLWNADMQLNEKGYYFAVLMFGLYTAISLQKTIRDKNEHIPTTSIYYLVTWFSFILSVLLLVIGLWNAQLLLVEKGFYAMSFVLSLFAVITVQKNIRDVRAYEQQYGCDESVES